MSAQIVEGRASLSWVHHIELASGNETRIGPDSTTCRIYTNMEAGNTLDLPTCVSHNFFAQSRARDAEWMIYASGGRYRLNMITYFLGPFECPLDAFSGPNHP